MLSMCAALAITIGLLLLTLHLLKRLQGGVGVRGRVPISVLQRVPMGQRQSVGLLRVGKRVLVVSMTDHGTSLLTELSGDELTQALEDDASPSESERPSTPQGFAGVLAALWRAKGAVRQRSAASRTFGRAASGVLVLALAILPFSAHSARAQAAKAKPAAPAPKVATSKPATPHVQSTIPIQATSPGPDHQGGGHPSPIGAPTVNAPGVPKIDFNIGQGDSQLRLSGTVGLVVFLGAMTLLPAIFLLMTSFTRILIVLHFLRTALGTQTAPPTQVLVALSILLTGVVMHPVLDRVSSEALTPYFNGQMSQADAYKTALVPFREFMLANVRDQDLESFAEMSRIENVKSTDDLPLVTVVAAFVTSELRTAFQMGFIIFLPFVVVDMIVASVLMSMGMMMLPPAMVSLPFKLLLFVLADGWTLVVRNLVGSFRL